jgi:hypothetical protein
VCVDREERERLRSGKLVEYMRSPQTLEICPAIIK